MAQGESKCAKCPLMMRIINISAALTLIGFGIAGLILLTVTNLTSGRFFLLFSPIFMVLVGLLFLAAEFNCEFITKHFVFLNSYLGRGVFDLFMASSVFYFFSCGRWISSILIFLLGVFYIGVHFCGGEAFKTKEETETARGARAEIN